MRVRRCSAVHNEIISVIRGWIAFRPSCEVELRSWGYSGPGDRRDGLL
jgi:hypothetical protein